LGGELKNLSVLEVGDSDGLLLRDLGKSGVGFNNSLTACGQIRRNGVAAVGGDGQLLPFPDKTFDVALCFETLEHAPAPYLMLGELSRVARRKVCISIPGVEETLVHPRIRGERRGEWHIIEFCERDFRAFLSHTSLRVSYYEPIRIFAGPRGIRERMSYWTHATRHLLAECFKFFQFYELEPVDDDLGLDRVPYRIPYLR
jgi:ubiquinone/menaquinone biosynthesis C-methylase UbiE